ncbi:MAG: PIG-L family deacetylase [Saprospiraceae bacterium]|nr:PIG-L family deacetylase [Saprospiraceae bacterium]
MTLRYTSLRLAAAIFLHFCLSTTLSVSVAQVAPKKPNSADIFESIKKLNVLGSVLYVAAHPDDENTRMISYFANARHMDITYLSLTRGDGGQNLIGSELREELGALRTQELLAARAVDGGKQLFSRANDFGFSKSPAESFEIWGKDAVLSDVVWAMRKVQPDIVINRFSTDTAFDTHGHHTGSAVLSSEAFDIVGNPSVYPEQLKYVSAWQPKRLFQNQSWWWYGSQEKFEIAMKNEQILKFDAGVYLPTQGKSNDEIAAESRSMHKCQGMGMMSSRGSNMEYVQYLKGVKGDVKVSKDMFEGINTAWSRLEGGAAIGKILANVERNFKFDNPAASVKDLLKARNLMQKLPESVWKTRKLANIQQTILWCAGIFLEVRSKDYSATPNGKLDITTEILNRSEVKAKLTRINFMELNDRENLTFRSVKDTLTDIELRNNGRKTLKFNFTVSLDAVLTSPYWLDKTAALGMYTVNQQLLRGLPETPRTYEAVVDLMIEGQKFTIKTPIVNSYANPAKGEIYRPLEVTPAVFVNLEEKVYVFGDENTKNVNFIVKSGAEKVKGRLKPEIPKGWTIEPEAADFNLKLKGEEAVLSFKLTPPTGESEGKIVAKAFLKAAGDAPSADFYSIETKSVKFIEYDHIPTQTVLRPAESKIVKLAIEKRGINIGYVMGAGDEMPACLEQIGYKITQIGDHDLQNADGLRRFDAIVVGVRAYNVKEKLKFYNQKLLDYVQNGGTMVVQYNTAGRDLVLPQFGPYPFKLGRGRTTEEDAPVRFLKPEHSVLNEPNKITPKDFDGWVQERGLYFLSEWDKNYEAILSCNDTNEKAENGGLVVARHGKGWYIYTGYSFFRELPMGVSGAYRLFANLLSIGKTLP